MTRQELLDSLAAERYGRSLWWRTPEGQHPTSAPDAPTDWDDSEATCARRRRAMAAEFAAVGDPRVEAS